MWAQQLWLGDSRARGLQQLLHVGLVAPRNVGSQFPDQELNLRSLHCLTSRPPEKSLFFSLWLSSIPHLQTTPSLSIHLLITLRLLSSLGYCKWWCCEHSPHVFLNFCFVSIYFQDRQSRISSWKNCLVFLFISFFSSSIDSSVTMRERNKEQSMSFKHLVLRIQSCWKVLQPGFLIPTWGNMSIT